jgi:hypothetical protein
MASRRAPSSWRVPELLSGDEAPDRHTSDGERPEATNREPLPFCTLDSTQNRITGIAMRSPSFRSFARTARVVCCSLLGATAGYVCAQELHVPNDDRLRQLSMVYQEDVPAYIASTCSQRFHDTQKDWDAAIGHFNGSNKVQLAELKGLQGQLVSALKAGHVGPLDVDTWAAVANARMELNATIGSMMAPLNDQEAQSYCDQTLKSYGQEVIDEASMNTARKAAAAAIEDLSKR